MTELPAKRFRRRVEDFTCERCDARVRGDGYTNHCPVCLWSKHVDRHPGDRAAECGGMMEPARVESEGGAHWLVHRCLACGFERRVRSRPEDDFERLLEVARSRSAASDSLPRP